MPRYTPSNCMGRNVAVYLDGKEVEGVLEADDDLGFVIVVAQDGAGNPIKQGADVKRVLKLGNVRVSFPTKR